MPRVFIPCMTSCLISESRSPKPGILQSPLYLKGTTVSTVTTLVFPTAAESPSGPGEDLAWSPGCDRHMAVQGRLNIVEEVRRIWEEGIVKLHGLCEVQMFENPGRSRSSAARLTTPCSNWDVQLGNNVLYTLPPSPRRYCLHTACDFSPSGKYGSVLCIDLM